MEYGWDHSGGQKMQYHRKTVKDRTKVTMTD